MRAAADQHLSAAVSPFTGIVYGVSQGMHFANEPCLHQNSAHTAAWPRYQQGRTRLVPFERSYEGARRLPYARGAAHHPSVALNSAVGEALERYAATHVPDLEPHPWTALNEQDAVGPTEMQVYRPEQLATDGFPYQPWTSSTKLRWAAARRLFDGAVQTLPAQFVYLSASLQQLPEAEPPIVEQVSSGLACGPTFEEAALRAVFELVERDALMLTWLRKLSLPLLAWEDDHDCRLFITRWLRGARLTCEFVDLSGFHGIPAVLAVISGPFGNRSHLSFGSAAAATIQDAWRRSLIEALMSREWLRTRARRDLTRLSADAVETVEAHAVYHHLIGSRASRFLLESGQRRSPLDIESVTASDPQERLRSVAQHLHRRGIDVYLVNVTSPDVAELGLCVVRAVAPALCRINLNHRARPLGTPRLHQPAASVNPDAAGQEHRLNEEPHPFA